MSLNEIESQINSLRVTREEASRYNLIDNLTEQLLEQARGVSKVLSRIQAHARQAKNSRRTCLPSATEQQPQPNSAVYPAAGQNTSIDYHIEDDSDDVDNDNDNEDDRDEDVDILSDFEDEDEDEDVHRRSSLAVAAPETDVSTDETMRTEDSTGQQATRAEHSTATRVDKTVHTVEQADSSGEEDFQDSDSELSLIPGLEEAEFANLKLPVQREERRFLKLYQFGDQFTVIPNMPYMRYKAQTYALRFLHSEQQVEDFVQTQQVSMPDFLALMTDLSVGFLAQLPSREIPVGRSSKSRYVLAVKSQDAIEQAVISDSFVLHVLCIQSMLRWYVAQPGQVSSDAELAALDRFLEHQRQMPLPRLHLYIYTVEQRKQILEMYDEDDDIDVPLLMLGTAPDEDSLTDTNIAIQFWRSASASTARSPMAAVQLMSEHTSYLDDLDAIVDALTEFQPEAPVTVYTPTAGDNSKTQLSSTWFIDLLKQAASRTSLQRKKGGQVDGMYASIYSFKFWKNGKVLVQNRFPQYEKAHQERGTDMLPSSCGVCKTTGQPVNMLTSSLSSSWLAIENSLKVAITQKDLVALEEAFLRASSFFTDATAHLNSKQLQTMHKELLHCMELTSQSGLGGENVTQAMTQAMESV